MATKEESFSSFKDLTKLGQYIQWTLYVFLGAILMTTIVNIGELQLFSDTNNNLFFSEKEMIDALEANDSKQSVVSILYLLIYIISVIFIARWIFLANKNARSLGWKNMRFSPGWSVGWYCIPLANLWKPYQAMKEIWVVSHQLVSARAPTSTWRLVCWWFLWLASSITANISFRLILSAQTIDEYMLSTTFALISDLITVPLCFVLLSIVKTINKMQLEAYAKGDPDKVEKESLNSFRDAEADEFNGFDANTRV